MVGHAELFLDHPGQHRGGPQARIQTVRYRTTVENVAEMGALLRRQQRRPAGPVSFQQSIHSVRLIKGQPLGHPRSRRLQNPRQFPAGAAFGVQDNSLQTLRHPVGAVPFRFLAEANQSAMRLGVQT